MNTKLLKKLIFSLIILAILFAPFTVSAQALGDAVNWIKKLPMMFLSGTMGWLVYFSAVFAKMNGGLLDWVTSPDFISLPYTKPGPLTNDPLTNGNPIIEAGLNITQNFVNLSLVVVLVFIALATTLRLQEYATRKTLVRLIIVALLVNFAPVICGLIVDASNIVMNYFLVGIREGVSGILTDISTAGLTGTLTRVGSVTALHILAKGAIMMILNIAIGFAFFLLAFVFIFRYVAIWMLVILSPLAFVAWILPATKRLWDMWWKQLLNWSFIGIPLAFFLYLAMRSVAGLNTYFETQISAPGLEPEIITTLDKVFPYFAVLGIIFFGFSISLAASAMGANAAINAAKWTNRKGGRIVGRATGATARKAGRWIRPKVERPVRKASSGVARTMQRLGALDPIGHIPGIRRIPGVKKLRPLAPFKWITPTKTLSDFGNLRPTITAVAKKADDLSGREKAHRIRTKSAQGPEGMGFLLSLLKGNDAQDLFNAFRHLGTDEEIVKDKKFIDTIAPLLKNAVDSGLLGSTLRRDPRLAKVAFAKKIGSYGDRKKIPSSAMAVSRATGEAREHIKDMEPEEFNDKDVMRSILANFEEDRMLQLNRQVKNGQRILLKNMDDDFSKFVRTESSFKGTLDDDLEQTLTIKEEIDANGNRKITESEDYKKAWSEYEEKVEQMYGGTAGFRALRSKRVQDRGYRTARFKIKTEEEPSGPTTSPGGALMGGPPPPRGRRPGGSKKPSGRSSSGGKTPRGRRAGGKKEVKQKEEKKQKEKAQQIPFMITNEMREELKKKGYENEDIKKMTPKEAWEKLGRSF